MSYGLTDCLIRCNPAAAETEKFSSLKDALIYVVQHGTNGAIGVNLNRFYQQNVADLGSSIPALGLVDAAKLVVPNLISGGPVQGDLPWVLAHGNHPFRQAMGNQHMTLSFSDDGFEADYETGIVCGVGTYGWGPKQLERELSASLWHMFPADYELLANIPFSDPPRFAVDLFMTLRFPDKPRIKSRDNVQEAV